MSFGHGSQRRSGLPGSSSSKSSRRSQGASPASKRPARCTSAVVVYDGLTSVCQVIFLKAGFVLPSERPPFLRVDQAVFQRDLTANLKNESSYPQNVEEFVESFTEHIEDLQKLYWCLSTTSTDNDCESARSLHQDSVIRILLGILDVQSPLMKTLLDKLLLLSTDDGFLANGGEQKNIPKMILYHLRRLDMLADSSMLCDKLLEIMSAASVDIQKEIIAAVPEILDDSDHERVAIAWSELLRQKTELTPSILDSMTILCVSADVLAEVQHIVLESFDYVDVEALPVVLEFLMECVTPQNATDILGEIRLTLKFSSQTATPSKNDAKQSYEVLALKVIKNKIRLKQVVGDTLVKVLEASKADKQPNLLDLFLLFLLVDVESYRKAAQGILVTKIRNATINEALVSEAFKRHTSVCQEYFKSVLLLVDFLFGVTDQAVLKFGGLFIVISFTEMNDASMLQEVIFAVVTRIRSERKAEVEIALDSIKQIVVAQPQKVAPYSVFLKGLLDRLERLSLSHIRKVYEILNLLGQSSNADNHGLLSDLHIIARKQLSNPDQSYRRMGVIGALTTLHRCETSTVTDDDLASARTLINTIEKFVAKDCEAKGLFYEELSSALQQRELHENLEEWLTDHVATDFQEEFICEKPFPDVHGMTGQLAFGENPKNNDDKDEGNNDDEIAINLLLMAYEDELIVGSSTLAKRSLLPSLPSKLRLLAICERVTHNNDLASINALLGCPVYLFHSDMLCDFQSKPLSHRKIVCRCLFAVMNWFIELINAFVTQKGNNEILDKVVTRIRQLVELQQQLDICLKSTPGFVPPAVHFDVDNVDKPIVETKSASKVDRKTKRKKQTGKGATKDKDSLPSTNTSQPSTSIQAATQINSTSDQLVSASKKSVDLNGILFRELDMEVFSILRRDLEMKLQVDDDSRTKLGLRELRFLLGNLHVKLEVVFEQKITTKNPFLSKMKLEDSLCVYRHLKSRPISSVVKDVLKTLKNLRTKIEIIGAFLLKEKERDSNTDPGDDDDDAAKMEAYLVAVECFCLIFSSCTTIFSWKNFDDQENISTLCKCLQRFNESNCSSQTTLTQSTKAAFEYFQQYSTVVPDFSSAVSLVKLLNSIAQKSKKKSLDAKLAEVCEEMLKRDWNLSSEECKTSTFINHLGCLLKTIFNSHEHVLELLQMLTTEVIPELINSIGRNECSEKFPTLTKITFPVYYETMLKQLSLVLREESATDKSDMEKLDSWAIGVRIFNVLAMLIKEFTAPKVLVVCLKHGRSFLELFVKTAMPIMDRVFRTHEAEVVTLLKTLQQSTRFLHNMCGQAKVNKNVSLANSVPALRKALETFVFRVKAMLTINNCKDAFWLGNLKNRNLQGEEILSQLMNQGDSDNSDVETTMDTRDNSDDEGRNAHSESDTSDELSNAGNASESY